LPYYWGVDSATKVTKDVYDCVLKKFGKPSYWGRYLAPIPGKVDGLSKDEVNLLHNSGTKVLPIYSNFNSAVGYRNGKVIAQNTIYQARRLGIPNGNVLFANLEKFFNIDEAWIRGFVDGVYPSGYKPGIYHDPVEGDFNAAYCAAVSNDNKIADQVILWSAEPEPGVTKARNAPNFRPKKPPCKGNVWGWQYGRDSEVCPIDTNLVNGKLHELLW
jgi:hypothetical protein